MIVSCVFKDTGDFNYGDRGKEKIGVDWMCLRFSSAKKSLVDVLQVVLRALITF